MTREEFLAKKNRFGIPGYTDHELMELYHCESSESPATKCLCCGNLLLSGEICLMCGMDDWQGTTRGQRVHYRELLKVHPEYIWKVNHKDRYSLDGVTFSGEELISIEEERMDIKSILQQVFGAVPNSFDEEHLKELQDNIDDEDYWNQKDYLYRKDIVNLLERVKKFADNDMSIVWDALVYRAGHVRYFQNNKNASKQDYLQYLAEIREHSRENLIKELNAFRGKRKTEFDFWFKDIWKDRRLILEAVKANSLYFQFAPKEIKDDREIALQAMEFGDILQYLSDRLRSDYEVVMESVSRYGKSLEFASVEFRSNPEIVYAAMRQNPDAFSFSSPAVRKEIHKRFRRKKGHII